MIDKIFHSASYRRKLPVPFFEVLDQEYCSLHGGATTVFSWDVTADHLKENTQELQQRIKPLLNAEEQSKLPESCTREELAKYLNQLIHDPSCLYFDRDFPKVGLRKETIAMTGLGLDTSELTRLNRLLLEEAFPGHLKKISDIHLQTLYRRIHDGEGSAALCLSGGGARSATFALGVVQGLAKQGLLKHFDYLSTVSGGGHLGSWLSSWIHCAGGVEAVSKKLGESTAKSVTQPEAGPLHQLRASINYRTPRVGIFSVDMWVFIGTYLQNLLLRWAMILPLLLAIFLVPRLHVALLNLNPPGWLIAATFLTGFVFYAWAVAYVYISNQSANEDLRRHSGTWFHPRDQHQFLVWCFAPLCLAAVCITTAWFWFQIGVELPMHNLMLNWFLEFVGGRFGEAPPLWLNYCLLGAALHATGWLIAETFLKRWRNYNWSSALLSGFIFTLMTGAVGGGIVWQLAKTSIGIFGTIQARALLYSCFAVPVLLLIFLGAATLFVGISGKVVPDTDRQRWTRMGAWVLIALLAWILFGASILFAPWLLRTTAPIWKEVYVAIGGISGVFTLLAGFIRGTGASKDSGAKEGLLGFLLEKGLIVSAPLAILFALPLACSIA